jgi:hypothetical protein
MEIRIMCIAWPAFLAACVLELLVFAFFDPLDLQWAGQALAWSRQAVYTGAFFTFWAVCTGACALAALLRIAPRDVNAPPRTTLR